MMHSHTGCICLAFLHCGFSYVSSNGLPELHTHIGCIYATFFIAFFYFSPLCTFKCILKLPARKEALLHWLHFLHLGTAISSVAILGVCYDDDDATED